eukprot:2596625-Amphidinium_carterae.1
MPPQKPWVLLSASPSLQRDTAQAVQRRLIEGDTQSFSMVEALVIDPAPCAGRRVVGAWGKWLP